MKALSGLVKFLFWLMVAPFVLIGILIVGVLSTLLYKAYWDWRVEMMCARDGGVVVYEKIFLHKAEYSLLRDEHGDMNLPTSEEVKAGDRYATDFISQRLNEGYLGLKVERYRIQVLHARSKQLIGEKITYARIGGDFPFSASHSSSFGCPEFAGEPYYKAIFIEVD